MKGLFQHCKHIANFLKPVTNNDEPHIAITCRRYHVIVE